MSNIKSNLDAVYAKLNGFEGTLVAVSKYHPIEKIIEANQLGLNDFGESRAQEFVKKYEQLPDVRWHFIGPLQTNKVKYLINKVYLIHSVDRLELLEMISKLSQKNNTTTNILLQVNIAKEPQKSGFEVEELMANLEKIKSYPNVCIKGLMMIAPDQDFKEIECYFEGMNNLFNELKKGATSTFSMEYLSMGMSSDLELAIKHGSNMVRIGTAIFKD